MVSAAGLTPYERQVLLEVRRRQAARMVEKERGWCPHKPTPRQAQFDALDCREALYGGAAGGGKSDALLMTAVKYVEVKGYAALLLRRTFADLALPGAIMDRAYAWFSQTAARWNDIKKTWTFPSGATLTFGYLEHKNDRFRYQSSEFQFIGYDELTQFMEIMYTYLLSRLRRLATSDIPLRQRGATNPGGIGHKWVHARFIDKVLRKPGAAFVPAKLEDNPHLDRETYLENLNELDAATRAQLRDGSWVLDPTGLIYRYTARNIVTKLPKLHEGDAWKKVLAIDYGSSQVTPSSAFALWYFSQMQPASFLVHCRKYAGLTPSTIADHVRALGVVHGPFLHIAGDQGGLGGGYNEEMRTREKIPVQNVEKKDKLGYRKLFRGALEGRPDQAPTIYILKDGSGDTDDWIEEADHLSWNEKGLDAEEGQPDHCTDGGLYGWRACRAYRAKDPPNDPPKGTAEAYEREGKKQLQRELERVEKRKSARAGDFFKRLR